MPSIEFIGYTRATILQRVDRYRALLSDSRYAQDVLFIVRDDCEAITLDGRSEPHAIVKSRFQDRLDETAALINRVESASTPNFIGVEVVRVHFHAAGPSSSKPGEP